MPPTQEDCLESFSTALESGSREATFTCGGSIPIVIEPKRTQSGDLTPRTDAKVHGQKIVTKPVTVRWGLDGQGRVLSLPGRSTQDSAALQDLVQACQPATFGRGGENVLDETYRRAGAMSTDAFSTGFCPYETGIIDVVTQLLLPPVIDEAWHNPGDGPEAGGEVVDEQTRRIDEAIAMKVDTDFVLRQGYRAIHTSQLPSLLADLGISAADEDELGDLVEKFDPLRTGSFASNVACELVKERMDAAAAEQACGQTLQLEVTERKRTFRGLRAELYKLNVYSSPSGMFKPHVDTPRSESQVGSLVVCLPAPFAGGALAVRHQDQEVVHRWEADSSERQPAIQWAAFYSDCEHEVLQVTAGHRITLTYNLFLSPGTGLLAGKPLNLISSRLPLVSRFQQALANPAFAPQGMYIAFALTHSYPHAHPSAFALMPKMLKGVDMALYEAVYATGLTCSLEEVNEMDLLMRADVLKDLDRSFDTASRPQGRETGNLDASHEVNSSLTKMEVLSDREGEPDEWEIDLGTSSSEEEDECYGSVRDERYWDLKERKQIRRRVTWIGSGRSKDLSSIFLAVSMVKL